MGIHCQIPKLSKMSYLKSIVLALAAASLSPQINASAQSISRSKNFIHSVQFGSCPRAVLLDITVGAVINVNELTGFTFELWNSTVEAPLSVGAISSTINVS